VTEPDSDGEADNRPSPARILNPEIRFEVQKAMAWVAVVGLAVLFVYISQSLLVIFGGLVFAAMIDGGARLLGRVLPIGRSFRILIVLLLGVAFFLWLFYFAGSNISQEAAQLPTLVRQQAIRTMSWLQNRGLAVDFAMVQNIAGQLMSGVGMVTSYIGGFVGGLTTMFLILIIGLYVALEPRLYERGLGWMLPRGKRDDYHVTMMRMASTMRRLLAGRLVGMVFEGVLTYALLAFWGVPMAALLGILTGLLAFLPNVGAVVSGLLMVLVGFSGGVDMGLYTISVYVVVQVFDGYVVVPLIARKTVDLAPALVLGAQLIMGILFGILGLFLADPLMAMIKVMLERRSERLEARENDTATPTQHGA